MSPRPRACGRQGAGPGGGGSIPHERNHGAGDHPIPSRTRQLSPASPKVLRRQVAGGQGGPRMGDGFGPAAGPFKLMAPSSSGLGRRPLKAEVAGSNPVGATKFSRLRVFSAFFVFRLFPMLHMGTRLAYGALGVKFQKVCPLGLFTACNSWACETPPKRCPCHTSPASHPVVSILLMRMHTSHQRRRPSA